MNSIDQLYRYLRAVLPVRHLFAADRTVHRLFFRYVEAECDVILPLLLLSWKKKKKNSRYFLRCETEVD